MEYLRTTYYYIPPSQSVYAALCDLYQTSRVILKPPYNYTVDVEIEIEMHLFSLQCKGIA